MQLSISTWHEVCFLCKRQNIRILYLCNKCELTYCTDCWQIKHDRINLEHFYEAEVLNELVSPTRCDTTNKSRFVTVGGIGNALFRPIEILDVQTTLATSLFDLIEKTVSNNVIQNINSQNNKMVVCNILQDSIDFGLIAHKGFGKSIIVLLLINILIDKIQNDYKFDNTNEIVIAYDHAKHSNIVDFSIAADSAVKNFFGDINAVKRYEYGTNCMIVGLKDCVSLDNIDPRYLVSKFSNKKMIKVGNNNYIYPFNKWFNKDLKYFIFISAAAELKYQWFCNLERFFYKHSERSTYSLKFLNYKNLTIEELYSQINIVFLPDDVFYNFSAFNNIVTANTNIRTMLFDDEKNKSSSTSSISNLKINTFNVFIRKEKNVKFTNYVEACSSLYDDDKSKLPTHVTTSAFNYTVFDNPLNTFKLERNLYEEKSAEEIYNSITSVTLPPERAESFKKRFNDERMKTECCVCFLPYDNNNKKKMMGKCFHFICIECCEKLTTAKCPLCRHVNSFSKYDFLVWYYRLCGIDIKQLEDVLYTVLNNIMKPENNEISPSKTLIVIFKRCLTIEKLKTLTSNMKKKSQVCGKSTTTAQFRLVPHKSIFYIDEHKMENIGYDFEFVDNLILLGDFDKIKGEEFVKDVFCRYGRCKSLNVFNIKSEKF